MATIRGGNFDWGMNWSLSLDVYPLVDVYITMDNHHV